MINVLIVDDHKLIRFGLKSIFNKTKDIHVIGDVASGEEAFLFAKAHNPHVIVMDICMPGIGGLVATRKIAHACPKSHILILSACDTEPFPSILLKMGATGFLSKDTPSDELLLAVRTVASGKRYLDQKAAHAVNNQIPHGEKASPFNLLSNKELTITLMLINGKDNKAIANMLYIATKTVSSHRIRIYKKLNISTDVELTLLAIQYGLIDDILTPDDNDTANGDMDGN